MWQRPHAIASWAVTWRRLVSYEHDWGDYANLIGPLRTRVPLWRWHVLSWSDFVALQWKDAGPLGSELRHWAVGGMDLRYCWRGGLFSR